MIKVTYHQIQDFKATKTKAKSVRQFFIVSILTYIKAFKKLTKFVCRASSQKCKFFLHYSCYYIILFEMGFNVISN